MNDSTTVANEPPQTPMEARVVLLGCYRIETRPDGDYVEHVDGNWHCNAYKLESFLTEIRACAERGGEIGCEYGAPPQTSYTTAEEGFRRLMTIPLDRTVLTLDASTIYVELSDGGGAYLVYGSVTPCGLAGEVVIEALLQDIPPFIFSLRSLITTGPVAARYCSLAKIITWDVVVRP